MSERMTEARTPDTRCGFALWGRKTRAEAIKAFREHYEMQRADAEAALAVTDAELIVTTYLGPYARRKCEVLPHAEGKP